VLKPKYVHDLRGVVDAVDHSVLPAASSVVAGKLSGQGFADAPRVVGQGAEAELNGGCGSLFGQPLYGPTGGTSELDLVTARRHALSG
jgi:hypothetical protein